MVASIITLFLFGSLYNTVQQNTGRVFCCWIKKEIINRIPVLGEPVVISVADLEA
jgi:hypothetical protein